MHINHPLLMWSIITILAIILILSLLIYLFARHTVIFWALVTVVFTSIACINYGIWIGLFVFILFTGVTVASVAENKEI